MIELLAREFQVFVGNSYKKKLELVQVEKLGVQKLGFANFPKLCKARYVSFQEENHLIAIY